MSKEVTVILFWVLMILFTGVRIHDIRKAIKANISRQYIVREIICTVTILVVTIALFVGLPQYIVTQLNIIKN